MNNVWKIGSRWGNKGASVLDLFLRYGCVLFGGKNDSGIGDWESVRAGDLFVVSDGATIVAIGEAVGVFTSYRDSGFHFRMQDVNSFIDDDVVICPAKIVLLEGAERCGWGNDPQKRFCSAPKAAAKARSCWAQKCEQGKVASPEIHDRIAALLDEINLLVAKALVHEKCEGVMSGEDGKLRAMAKEMLKDGDSVTKVARISGLSEAEVIELQCLREN